MKTNDLIQILLYFSLIIALTPVLGRYIANIFEGKEHFMKRVLGWLERLIYRSSGIQPERLSGWKAYTRDLLVFNLLGFLVVFLIQLVQNHLPLNPENLPNVSWHSSFNTAISFMTNTNWQGYAGETTMSYLVQTAGLTVQNFVSAATGIAVMIALIRGITNRSTTDLGNFYVDMTRSVVYILLPLSILFALVLAGEGIVQTVHSYITVDTLEGATQKIALGPAASQIAIKQLGTNGGGFFNANSAHPFENPTPLSNFLEMLAILLIPAALTYTYGKMCGSVKQGWVIFTVMGLLLVAGLSIALISEYSPSPVYGDILRMEGKETRFGITGSVLWATVTTAASNGSVNAMHDSFSALGGLVYMVNIMLGEVIFGGVGAGLYGMVVFIILTVFIAGLMVGRTPEYLGKKIEAFEVKMSILAVLAPAFVILVLPAISCSIPPGLTSLNNSGPHGLSEILYAYSSAAGNNGSAFAGLNANTVFYNITLGIAMLIGRFGVIIPVLAIAGSLSKKQNIPISSGTFRTDHWLFVILLIGVVLIIGGLTFFPALSLGPVIEHLLQSQGIVF